MIGEADCGHVLNELFTLCYLAAAGVDIPCIAVTSGERDQLATVRLFCE